MKRIVVLTISLFFHGLVFLRAVVWLCPRLFWKIMRGKLYPENERGNEEGEGKRLPYLMLLSFIEWDGSWQRPQHLAMQLADSGKMGVLCCSPVRAHNALGRAWELFRHPEQVVRPGLTVLRPLVLPGEYRLRFIRKLNNLILFDCLQRQIMRRGDVPSVLMTNSPFYSTLFTTLPARLRVYDVMDELIRFPWAPQDAGEQERLVALAADLITTGTKSLERLKLEEYGSEKGISERLPPLSARVAYVPCGVDAEHFATALGAEPSDYPDSIRSLSHPIIGFFGALNERVDPAIIETLAREMPEASIALIGPSYGSFSRLRRLKNVHFLGHKSYLMLPRYLAAFDCAIIPYRLSEGIEFVQPVKALEYLAGGKPVVSTAIPDLLELYGDKIRIAKDPDEFVVMVREAVAEGGEHAEKYVDLARRRGWETMKNEFLWLFEDVWGEKNRAPRRVAHLLHGVNLGGAEEVVVNLCAEFGREKGEILGEVVCLGTGELVQKRLRRKRLTSHIVEMRGKIDLGVLLRLIALLRARRVDLIHTHTGRTNLVGRLAGRLAGLPTVATVHTAVARDINDVGRSNWLNARVEAMTREWSRMLLTVSGHNREEIVRSGFDEGRVAHVLNGVDLSFEPIPEEKLWDLRKEFRIRDAQTPVIGMVASMRPRKGPEVLLRAMKVLAAEFPDLRLLMVGSVEFVRKVDYLEQLRALARAEGVEERVVFTGHRDDVRSVLALMDVAVLPSLFGEGLPLSILEAMASGRPVVATATEGNDEVVVHERTGLLVPPKDPKALAEAIASLLRDPATAARMGDKGRRQAERLYSLQAMAKGYGEIYNKILG